jgi:hypothetical protein
LDFKKVGLNGGGATKAPQQGCESKHLFPRHGRFGAVVGDDCGLERFVVFGVFQSSDDRFGCQSMPDSVGSLSLFAIVGFRPGAPQRVASIGLELLK